jgi:hypothetical protein
MADTPFLISGIFLSYILPFALIFTLVFAILQKTKLLGDDKKSIDAIIGLIVGLILIAFGPARDIVVKLQVFLAVFVAILLVFMILYGFVSGKKDGDVLAKGWKYAFYAIITISLAIALIVITGYWGFVQDLLFSSTTGSMIWINGLIIVVIVGAIIAVLVDKGKSS